MSNKKGGTRYTEEVLNNLEKYEKELLKRYEYLKKRLSNRNDKTDHPYNWSKETLQVAFEVNKTNVKRNNISKSTRKFIREVKYYSTTPINIISIDIAQQRENAYLKRLQEISNTEYDRAVELLNMLTNEEKETFFFSDFFFINKKKDSVDYLKFSQENNRSIEVAKLEDYVKECGYDVKTTFQHKEDFDYDEDLDTKTKRAQKRNEERYGKKN